MQTVGQAILPKPSIQTSTPLHITEAIPLNQEYLSQILKAVQLKKSKQRLKKTDQPYPHRKSCKCASETSIS